MDALSEAHTDLRRLVDETRAEFGVRCFWNVPIHPDPILDAKVVAKQLRKHGGLSGLHRAAEIETGLSSLGETPWR